MDGTSPSKPDEDRTERNFRIQRIVYSALCLVALIPVFFLDNRAPYLIVWAAALVEFLALSWLSKATALGRLSKKTARVLAPVIAIALLGRERAGV